MSEWTHNIVVVVPETLIAEANALALAIGTSDADGETFQQADFAVKSIIETVILNDEGFEVTEKTINYSNERYAIANTRAVAQIMDYFALVPDELAVNVVFPEIVTAENSETLIGSDMTKIQVFVDQEPFHVLSSLNLVRVNE